MRTTSRCGLGLALVSALFAGGGAGASELLPGSASYDGTVPTVEEVLGQPIGRWHLRHDQLVTYLERLAEASPRLRLEEQGRTHEGRRQVLLVVTAPDNHARLDEILERRRALTDPSRPAPSDAELADLPSVALLGYSIHGDEASGSNASPLVAYHLAAAESAEVDEWLRRTIVLIDPSLNPDGMGRFAQWANMHRGESAMADPNHREHNQGWPGGRTNHYWFDLNRDWLLLQHPESRARVATFQRWKPNLLGDYHEMGSDSTYFFQPGVPERENPYKPERNLELTRRLAALHARNLGADGQLFYSEETFDDFYPGKGSTYPDLNGSVGVLFEQASARGHVQETDNGELTFERAIRNHFLASLSMIEGAATLSRELLRYQSDFFRDGLELGRADAVGAYVFGCPRDPVRCWRLADLVRAHGVEVHALGRGVEADGEALDPAWSWIVPVAQPQYRLVKALFETQTEFGDSTFYDISTWTLPLAFGARWTRLPRTSLTADHLGVRLDTEGPPEGRFAADGEAYAYLFDWSSYFAPRALYRLLEAGFRPRVATEPFAADLGSGATRDFGRGSIVVPVGGSERRAELEELLGQAAERDAVEVLSTPSGLTPVGVDLGSPSIEPLERIRPLLVAGRGISSYEVGEAWHLLDHRFGIEVSLVEPESLAQLDLADYTHVLMVDGSYDEWDDETTAALRDWVEAGGVVVATKGAAQWADATLLAPPPAPGEGSVGPAPPAAGAAPPNGSAEPPAQAPAEAPAELPAEAPGRRRYGDYERERAAELVSGTIFGVDLDLTHPVAYGYQDEQLPVFRDSELLLEPGKNPYERVAVYRTEPLLSGYVSAARLAEIGGRDALRATRLGSGTVILMADNPNFRAFWYGTSKLYLNAILFGPIIETTTPPADW
jgi:hypothetical protein